MSKSKAAPSRRAEDADPEVLIAECANNTPFVTLRRFRVGDGDQVEAVAHETGLERLNDVALLLALPGGSSLALPASEAHLLEHGSERDRIVRTAHEFVAWRRERSRINRRLQLPDRIFAFTEDLGRANSPQEVYAAAMQHVPRIIDAYACIIFAPLDNDPDAETLVPVPHPVVSFGVHDLSLPERVRYGFPELILAAAMRDPHGTFAPLSSLFHDYELVYAAFVPLGDAGSFIIAERRDVREFTADDWHLARALARQLELALERVRQFDQVQNLSLTDPLTGIGNRRRLDVLLEHSIAGARRGDPLTVVLMDLDGFKAINDRDGHLIGDQILRTVARTLHDQLRGSDMVVRYGGDEFLMVLHGNAEAAEILIDRVRRQLADVVSFSIGIAEYETATESAEQLIDMADRNLYQRKKQAAQPAANM